MNLLHPKRLESQATRLMAVDMISHLLASTDSRELGQKLTEQLCELTGARTVLLLAHRGEQGGHQLLHVCPARKAMLFPPAELRLFCPEHTPDPLPPRTKELPRDHPLQVVLLRAGIESLLRFPLYTGGELLGALLLFDLPALDRISEARAIITLLSPPIALALRNAMAHEQIERQRRAIQHYADELERRVHERTTALASANEDLIASRRAALNIMEDAFVARRSTEEANTALRREIEERRRAEQGLEEYRRFLEKVVNTSPSLIYIYDLVERSNVYANRETLEFLGYDPERVKSEGAALMANIAHPEDLPRIAEHHGRFAAVQDDDVLELEYRIKDVAGRWRWMYSRDVLFSRD